MACHLGPHDGKIRGYRRFVLFIGEFFLRHSYPLRWQHEQNLALAKRARVDV
jgi:hypothetical protein